MNDDQIIDLFWNRSERAISEVDAKYGKYCFSIANHILTSTEDAEECVSDTYLSAWNQIPPTQPQILSVFLGRITRNISISRWRAQTARKRGGGEMAIALEELGECAGTTGEPDALLEQKELGKRLREFCGELNKDDRIIFLKRYWYLNSLTEIAEATGCSTAKIKSSLFRSRQKLRLILIKEALYEYC